MSKYGIFTNEEFKVGFWAKDDETAILRAMAYAHDEGYTKCEIARGMFDEAPFRLFRLVAAIDNKTAC